MVEWITQNIPLVVLYVCIVITFVYSMTTVRRANKTAKTWEENFRIHNEILRALNMVIISKNTDQYVVFKIDFRYGRTEYNEFIIQLGRSVDNQFHFKNLEYNTASVLFAILKELSGDQLIDGKYCVYTIIPKNAPKGGGVLA